MSIRRGDVVSHSKAVEWGVGKVLEVTGGRISIEFNDGTTRKIASSHSGSLLPAAAALFIPISPVPSVATKAAPRAKKVPKVKAEPKTKAAAAKAAA